jgi:hypothetical protein
MSTRLIAVTVLVVLMVAMVPVPSPAVVTVPQAAPKPGPMPEPTEVLLDVAAHNAAWIASIRGDLLTLAQAYAALNKISVAMPVKLQMMLALRHGGWIITTTHPVTSQGWTGTPWIVIKGPMQGFYNNALPYTNFSAGDHMGVTTNGEESTPGQAFAQSITAFGKALGELGGAMVAMSKGMPAGPGKAATLGLGLGLAALGLAVASIGLQEQAAIIANTPKQGHADDGEPDTPEGVPSITIPDLGQGGSGIGPAGSDGSAPSGPGPSGGGGSTGDSGAGDE